MSFDIKVTFEGLDPTNTSPGVQTVTFYKPTSGEPKLFIFAKKIFFGP